MLIFEDLSMVGVGCVPTVQGYQIDLISKPWQVSVPTAPHLSTEQLQLIREEVG